MRVAHYSEIGWLNYWQNRMLYAKQVHMQYPDKHGNYDIETEPKDSGRSQGPRQISII